MEGGREGGKEGWEEVRKERREREREGGREGGREGRIYIRINVYLRRVSSGHGSFSSCRHFLHVGKLYTNNLRCAY